MPAIRHHLRAWGRLLAAGMVVGFLAAVCPLAKVHAANWTSSLSSNWASPGFDGSPEGPSLTNHILNSGQLVTARELVGSNVYFGAFPLVSTTATLIQTSTTGDLRISRTNYAFTIAPGAGNTLSWTTGLFVQSESTNANSQNPMLANRVDVIVLAPVQIRSNFTINNGGAAGQMKLMGDVSELTAGLAMTARGDVVFGGSNSYTGATTLGAGRTVLDYANSDTTKFADAAALNLGNGNTTLTLAGGSHTEVVGSTNFRNGAISIRRSGGSSTLSAGDLSFTAGSAVDFELDSLVTTTSTNTRDILGGGVARATVGGASWATAAGGAIVGLSAYGVDDFTSNTNTDVTQSATLDGITTNSLRFNTAGGQTLTFAGNNTLQSGGILVTPGAGSATSTITGGTLTPSGQMVIHQHNTAGILDIASNINMAQGLVKSGSGTVRFSNVVSNTGAGAVSIHQGVVELNTAQNVFGTGAIRFDGGDIRNAVGGNVTIANPITLGPDEAHGFFSRVGFGGTGTITLGNTVTLAGASTNYKTVQVDVASGVTVITSSNVTTSSAPTLEKIGSGTFSVRGPGSVLNATSAPLVVSEGVFQLAESAAWVSAGANLRGGTLELNNETTNVNDRWSNVNAWGGELRLVGNALVATSEALSTTMVRAGATTLTVESKGQVTDLQTVRIGQWSPSGVESNVGTTMLVRGTLLGSGSTGEVARIIGTTASNGYPANYNRGTGITNTPTANVIPWMIADDSATGLGKTLATFVIGGNGYRPLDLATEVLTSDSNTIGNYYFSGSGTTAAANRTWRSLQLDGGHTLVATTGTSQITMNAGPDSGTAGTILSTGAANTIDSSIRLNSGNSAFYFHTVTDLDVLGAITAGSGPVVKSSGGMLTLSGTSNRSTGNTYVNQGVLKVANTNGLYDMSTFAGTPQLQRVVTVWGRPGSDAGVLELAGVNWSTGTATAPGIVLEGDNATLRGSGISSYGNGGAAYLSAYGDVFLEALGAESVFTLDSPVSRDSGLATTINVKGAGKVVLGAGAGNSMLGTSRGNAEMDWFIGGSRNGDDGWLAVNTSSAVGVSTNTFYVGNGGMLGGNGIIGSAVIVQNGGVISPGNSTGLLTQGATTFESGGSFRFEINSVAGTAGSVETGWDLLDVPSLAINATVGSPFFIDMVSLTSGQTAGTLFDFVDTTSYEWMFVDADAEIAAFDPTVFQFNVAEFQTPGDPVSFNQFSVRRGTAGGSDLNRLYIVYTAAIPEPGTLALVGIAGVVLAARQVRRRRRAA